MRELGLSSSDGCVCLQEQSLLTNKMFEFVGHLVCNRAFSGAVYDSPPYCYAKLLSSNVADKEAAMVAMRRDSKLLFDLEVCKNSATPNIVSNRHIFNIAMLASKVCTLTSCCILTVSGETRM